MYRQFESIEKNVKSLVDVYFNFSSEKSDKSKSIKKIEIQLNRKYEEGLSHYYVTLGLLFLYLTLTWEGRGEGRKKLS